MSEVGVTRSAASGILGGSHEDHTGIIRDLEGGNQSGAGGVQGVVGRWSWLVRRAADQFCSYLYTPLPSCVTMATSNTLFSV